MPAAGHGVLCPGWGAGPGRCGGTRVPGSLHCASHPGGCGGAGAEPGAEVSEGLREGLTLTAKGHSAPGSAGDNGARLLQPTSPPAPADPQEKPLSPFQVMPKPRRRPWPGAVLGHPSCCSSPCSCSSTWAVSAVHPVLSHSHPQHPEPIRGRQERRQHGRHGQDGAWHVPVACPTLGSSSPEMGGPSKGRGSSLCPAWALRS